VRHKRFLAEHLADTTAVRRTPFRLRNDRSGDPFVRQKSRRDEAQSARRSGERLAQAGQELIKAVTLSGSNKKKRAPFF